MSMLSIPLETMFGYVVESSLAACLIVCAVLLLQRLFRARFSPRWRSMLWTLLIVRLLLPWTPESPLSLAGILPAAHPAAFVQMAEGFRPGIVREFPPARPGLSESSVPRASAPQPAKAPAPRISHLSGIVSLVWITGCLLFGARVTASFVRVPRRLRRAAPVTDARILGIFEACKREMNLARGPALLADEGIVYPVVCGVFRPCLLMPRRRLSALSDTELRHIFLHELAHVKRGDLPLALLSAALQSLHWFNPVVWYGFHRMRQDREFACDALALSRMTPGEADGYGHTLIRLLEHHGERAGLAGAAAILEHKSQLRRRIEMIARFRSSPYRLTWVGLALFLACAAVLLTRASAAPGAPDNSALMPALEPLPHNIPIETYQTEWSQFRPGDSITLSELRGSSPRIEAGQTYQIKGHYVLASQERAMMSVFCANGETEDGHSPKSATVSKGAGDFCWEFKLLKPGMLHVSFYPSGGGSGFGGCHFRLKPVAADAPDAVVDLAVSDADFNIRSNSQWPGSSLNVNVRNLGNAVSPPFKIYFYEGDPATTEPANHGGGPVYPGECWSESSLPVNLHEGSNTFYVKINPDNAVKESDTANNTAKLTVTGRKVMKEVIEVVKSN